MAAVWAIACAVLVAAEAAAAPRPAWVDRTPEADKAHVYAVGEGEAPTRPEAEKIALRDALAKLAAQVRVAVTGRTISTISTKAGAETFSEVRESLRTRLEGAEPADQPWVEARRGGVFPFRRVSGFRVKVLVLAPRAAMERERQRQESASKDYRAAIDRLAQETAAALRDLGLGEGVAVGAFREAASGRAYTLSGLLAKDVADGLVRAGLTVGPSARARAVVTGAYRVHGGEIVVTARVRRVDTGQQVAVADAVFDKDAVEPGWLEVSTPIEPFFDAMEPARADTRTRHGAISIDSNPQGARVYLDGEDRGMTPVDLREVPEGKRAVTLLLDDYEAHSARVEVLEGEKSPVEAVLRPKTGDLAVTSVPGGAEVLVAGRRRGRTPLTLEALRVGDYRLTLRLKDHEDAVVEATIRHRQTAPIAVEMVELPGSLFVVTDPPGATILVDGAEVGKAQAPAFLKLDRVAAGLHRVEALVPGLGVWRGEVRVKAREVAQVTATITDQRGTLLLSLLPAGARVQIGDQEWDGLGQTGHRSEAALPGMSPPGSTPRRSPGRSVATVDDARLLEDLHQLLVGGARSVPATLSIPLVEGKHQVRVVAPGYKPVTRPVRVQKGRIVNIAVSLKPRDDTGGLARMGGSGESIMPLTAGFIAECRQTSRSVGDHILNCGLGMVLGEALTLGLYPVGADLLALPFRAASRSFRYFAGPSGRDQNPQVVAGSY